MFCGKCGTEVREEFTFCGKCGSPVQAAQPTSEAVPTPAEQKLRPAEALTDPKQPADFKGDKVGAGRYIICFLTGGFPGLLIAYWARYYGWRCVWIIAVVWVVMMAGGFCVGFMEGITKECYYDYYGNRVCE